MGINEELKKYTKRLGFDDPDEAIRAKWKDVPKWLQKELVKLGFNHKKDQTNRGISPHRP